MQFVKGVETLYEQGARIFVEVGPKRVLSGLATDILKEHKDVTVLSTNHPRKGDIPSINEAIGRLYAAGVTGATAEVSSAPAVEIHSNPVTASLHLPMLSRICTYPGRGRSRACTEVNIHTNIIHTLRRSPHATS